MSLEGNYTEYFVNNKNYVIFQNNSKMHNIFFKTDFKETSILNEYDKQYFRNIYIIYLILEYI